MTTVPLASVRVAVCRLLASAVVSAPVPATSNVNAGVFGSELLMVMVAVRNPAAEGLNVTTNVVEEPALTLAAGCVVTVKSPALAPVMVMAGAPRMSLPPPVLLMVKVRVTLSEPGTPA